MRTVKFTQIILIAAALALGGSVAAASDAHANPEAAAAAFQDGDWALAAEHYAELLRQDPDQGGWWFRLGRSHLNLGQYAAAAEALRAARMQSDPAVPPVAVLLSLARALAGAGDAAGSIEVLRAIAASGARPYLPVKNAAEFSALAENADFQVALDALRPCMSEAHRAFDFWLGEWQVTTPARPGWTARSRITRANDGCSVHEDYLTQGGYAGRSINFYDPQKQQWHQAWVDNQGAPLYLDGNPEGGAMILSNPTSRVTWSVLEDGRVRQHWESTADEGRTWTTAFDGYYQRREVPQGE